MRDRWARDPSRRITGSSGAASAYERKPLQRTGSAGNGATIGPSLTGASTFHHIHRTVLPTYIAGAMKSCVMSKSLIPGADPGLRRLLEHPAPPPRQRRSFTGTRAMRVVASVADAVQIILLSLALRPLFPGAAETFPLAQSVALALLAATLAVAARRALRPTGRMGTENSKAVATRSATATFVAIVLVSAICWVTLSQSTTPSPRGRTAWFLAWAVASSFGSAGLRFAIAWLGERLESGCRVLIIGSPDHAGPVARAVQAAPRSSWRLVGSIDDRQAGALDRAVDTIAQGEADLVVLAFSGPDAAVRVGRVCERIADQPVRVSLALDTNTLAGVPRTTARFDGLPLFDIADDPHGGLGGMAKRCLDIGLGSFSPHPRGASHAVDRAGDQAGQPGAGAVPAMALRRRQPADPGAEIPHHAQPPE